MRFSLPVVAVLTTATFAAPNQLATKDTITTTEAEQAFAFAIQAANCNALSCVSVVASAACIVAGIAARSVPTVLGCVSGGASKLCDCAGCVDSLGDFLDKNGLC